MRPTDAVAWSEAMDCDVRDVPFVLVSQLRRLEDIRTDLLGAYKSLAEAPDQDLTQSLWRSVSALGAAAARVHDAAASAQRTA